jgi:hypothetical protein
MTIIVIVIIIIKLRVKVGKNEIVMSKMMVLVVMKIPHQPSATSQQFKKHKLASVA